MTFLVKVPELHYSHMVVEATNKWNALDKVRNGQGEEVELVYSRTLDDEFEVEQIG